MQIDLRDTYKEVLGLREEFDLNLDDMKHFKSDIRKEFKTQMEKSSAFQADQELKLKYKGEEYFEYFNDLKGELADVRKRISNIDEEMSKAFE